ncbi:unnamed protein product [Rotaria magnacalcarata]|uniref:NAD(P)(+)--arginine ADP-ribosyltransferase n=2 Tax=Rotaria magnacalcarata TaxID=392030 RepID=A0A816BWA1_9BILA|nr:unnamed protein product [Rotaria magnacalcarata]
MDKKRSHAAKNVNFNEQNAEKRPDTSYSENYVEYNTEQVTAVLKHDTTETAINIDAASSAVFQSYSERIIQDFILVWLDENLDENNDNFQHSLIQLRVIVNTLEYFTDPDQCVDYLTTIEDEKILLVVSWEFFENIVPLIHDMSQLHTIFGFYSNNCQQQEWSKEWSKVKSIHSSIQPICASLQKFTREHDHNAIPMSFISNKILEASTTGRQNLDQLDPSYMYSMLFKEILLETEEDDTKALDNFAAYCRKQNIYEPQLNRFLCVYHQKSPIWCYSLDSFLYSMLNNALRLLDMETMIKLGFFIRSLHRQLEQLHQEQSHMRKNVFFVYRGQGLTRRDFQRLSNANGGLLSFNNFLSTTEKEGVAMIFVRSPLNEDEDIVGVLFSIKIDPSKILTSSTSYALINSYSAINTEDEILFSMHAVFRVTGIEPLYNNNHQWKVQLTITDDNDPQLSALSHRIREEISGRGWHRMSQLMLKVGCFNPAKELYDELLKQASHDSERTYIYNQLGEVRLRQGQFKDAASFFKKSLEISRKTLREDDASLATTYSNTGTAYRYMGEYSKALEFYEKSVKLKEESLPSNHPDLALSYDNIGQVYGSMGEYLKALEFYEKSAKIKEESLLSNHPDLAISYNNIGQVHDKLGDYPKALEFHEKSLKIKEISLPPNHPSMSISYDNIGLVYNNMGNYTKALEFYNKNLEITLKTLSPNHPSLAISYNNIGLLYHNMGDYSKALQAYKISVKKKEISLDPNHPSLAASYSNIGAVYQDMGKYLKAIEFCEKDLKIKERSLPSNHPDLAISYSNIGVVYKVMGDYSKALEFYEKSHQILEKVLPENHPSLATSYNNMGSVYESIGEYLKALQCYEKSYKIYEISLPENHPSLTNSYNNIGSAYDSLGEYLKALEFYGKSVAIIEKTSHPNDPSLASYYNNIGQVHEKLGDYAKSLEFHEKSIKIKEKDLNPNYHSLAIS